jgi:hypothetical protein
MQDQNATNDLLLLRMELRAIRDRVVADLDAALAKIDSALPEPAQSPAANSMKLWNSARWSEFLETGK